MIVRWLMYVAIGAITAILAILYPDYTAAFLFVGVLSYPVVAWAELMLHRIFLSVSLTEQSSPAFLQISNKSLFPVWQLKETYQIINQMTGETLTIKRDSELESYSWFTRELSDFSTHYGLYRLEKSKLQLSDMFGLLRVCKRLPDLELFLSTPLETSLAEGIGTEEKLMPIQIQEACLAAGKGEEEPDLREIREFLPGDRQNRIHQRLSAKLEKPMVRVLETEESPGLLLIPKLDREKSEENDRCLEFLASLARQCLKYSIRADVWLPSEEVMPVRTQTECERLFYQILTTPLSESKETNPAVLPQNYQMFAWIDGNGVTYQERGGKPS